MKTRRLTTILTSAYVSAMFASSVTPIRNDATLAAAIDPMAAQKAFQTAVNGLDAAGWLAAVAASPTAAEPTPKATPPPKAEPVMTEELMARLIKFVRNGQETGGVSEKICKVLNLCDGTQIMPLKMGESETAKDGEHFFGIPLDLDSKDILIMVKHGTVLEAYLTDKTGKLRAAAVLENGTAHLITNEKAAAKFKAELSLFAGEAAGLPPAGTAVAGNS